MNHLRAGIVAVLALIAGGVAQATADDANGVYKLVVKDHALYGTPVGNTQFRTCGGMVIERPSNAHIERISGSCPPDRAEGFRPYSGHAKLPPPRAAASRAPSPRPS